MKEFKKNVDLEHKIQNQKNQRWTIGKIRDKMKYMYCIQYTLGLMLQISIWYDK